jgi:hypothetical protein
LRRRIARALAELGAVAPLGAVCLLAANDHEGKRLFHNALTGKLSDVAICFLLPLLVSATLGLLGDWPGRRRLAVGAIVATGVFTLLELSDVAGALFVRVTAAVGLGGGALTRDPTDLLALVCVPLAVAYGRRRLALASHGASVWRSATGALVLVTGSLALMATSAPAGQAILCADDKGSVPAVFFAEAGCGPGGLIVVDADDTGRLAISNAAALGLPLFTGVSSHDGSTGSYGGGACPFTLDQGEWDVTVEGCPAEDVDAGSTGAACSAANAVKLKTCHVDPGLSFNCTTSDGGACSSRLRVVSP